MSALAKAIAVSVAAAGAAYFGPSAMDHIRPHLQPLNPLQWATTGRTPTAGSPFVCEEHGYTTQLVSMDPLLIYISNFVQPSEAAAIIDLGTPLLTPSPLTGGRRRWGRHGGPPGADLMVGAAARGGPRKRWR